MKKDKEIVLVPEALMKEVFASLEADGGAIIEEVVASMRAMGEKKYPNCLESCGSSGTGAYMTASMQGNLDLGSRRIG